MIPVSKKAEIMKLVRKSLMFCAALICSAFVPAQGLQEAAPDLVGLSRDGVRALQRTQGMQNDRRGRNVSLPAAGAPEVPAAGLAGEGSRARAGRMARLRQAVSAFLRMSSTAPWPRANTGRFNSAGGC